VVCALVLVSASAVAVPTPSTTSFHDEDAPPDVEMSEADVVYNGPVSEDPTFFQGQIVFRSADIEPSEDIEIRHLDADDDSDVDVDDAGLLESQITADADGEILIDTADFPADEYLIEDSDNDIVGQFETVVQRFTSFTFDHDRVENGGSAAESDLFVGTNRADYVLELTAVHDGEEADAAVLESIVGIEAIEHVDPDDDGTNESVRVPGSADMSIAFNFSGQPTGRWNVTGTATDATPSSTTGILVSADTPFDAPIPGTGARLEPTDPDGDGLFEDVDGDLDADFDDAVALAFADKNLTEEQTAALDFDGDGDLDFDDAIQLAFEV
jgi:PKD repeat protein